MDMVAKASLFQIEIYLATETYNIGDPRWLLYPPKPVSGLSNRNLQGHLADKPFTTHTLIILYHVNIETSLHDAFTTHTHTHTHRYTHIIIETVWYNYASKFCYCISL